MQQHTLWSTSTEPHAYTDATNDIAARTLAGRTFVLIFSTARSKEAFGTCHLCHCCRNRFCYRRRGTAVRPTSHSACCCIRLLLVLLQMVAGRSKITRKCISIAKCYILNFSAAPSAVSCLDFVCRRSVGRQLSNCRRGMILDCSGLFADRHLPARSYRVPYGWRRSACIFCQADTYVRCLLHVAGK